MQLPGFMNIINKKVFMLRVRLKSIYRLSN